MTRRKKKDMTISWVAAVFWVLAFIFMMGLAVWRVLFVVPKVKAALIDPTSSAQFVQLKASETLDFWVDKYANKYSRNPTHTKYLLHCLLRKESNYGLNKGHGDNGKAGGPMQYHNPTWNAFRKIMGKERGSRYNMEQAIETTAWALSVGRGRNWGPILRGECK